MEWRIGIMTGHRLREFRRWHIEKNLLGVLLRPDTCGWKPVEVADTTLPVDLIKPRWRCYCAGVGEDIRLERHLAESLGAEVWAFDPTPRSIAFMERSQHDRSRLHFMPVGLWRDDVTLHFHPPENPNHVSHSLTEAASPGGFDAPCRSVTSLMSELSHDSIDVLKMNIEGAEDIVLESTLSSGIKPKIITLTFEGSNAFSKALRWTSRLRREGYRFFARRAWFFTYVRADQPPA